MLVLLPPSETKARRRRGAPLRLDRLSAPELTDAREQVLDALQRLGSGPEAMAVLGVGAGVAEEVRRNTLLRGLEPTLPVRDLYTGVLYAALDLPSLDPASSRRASRRLVVVSALYGALRPTDRVAPYRLSMGVNLPGTGPLAGFWRGHLDPVLSRAAGAGLVVDCRSSTYAAAWAPSGPLAERWVHVRVPGATHMAKHTRGLVARALCRTAADPKGPEDLVDLLADRLQVRLAAPGRPGRPWVLDVEPA